MLLEQALADSLIHLDEQLLGDPLQPLSMGILRDFVDNRVVVEDRVYDIHVVLKRILVQVMDAAHTFE